MSGTTIEATMGQQFRILNTDQIELDLHNPRIARFIEKYGTESINSAQISMALGVGGGDEAGDSGPTYNSLRESIRTNGGIIHPIIVNETEPQKYTVIEGNTRLAIYREFDEDNVNGNWKTIPAVVYENLDQARIDSIRLQAHLVGPRQWDPYSKAKYLHHLRNSEHLTMSQIEAFCGGKTREVMDYIEAYITMEKYYRKALASDDEFDTTRFSAFVEVQKSNIKQALLNNNFTMSDFAVWVRDSLISPLNTVRQLPQIFSNPRAKEVFLRDGAKEAIKVLNVGSDPTLESADIESLAATLYKKLSSLPMDEFKEMKRDLEKQKVVALFSLEEELVETCKMLRDE
jgi:hypothetical protein